MDFTGHQLTAGIGERLDLLTALYCPDEEEPAQIVLARLLVEPLDQEAWALYYRSENSFIRVERWRDTAARKEAIELWERVNSRKHVSVQPVISLLESVTEIVGFELRFSDTESMGWPISVAAAAWLAAAGQGLIYAEGQGWLRPTLREIKIVLPEIRPA